MLCLCTRASIASTCRRSRRMGGDPFHVRLAIARRRRRSRTDLMTTALTNASAVFDACVCVRFVGLCLE